MKLRKSIFFIVICLLYACFFPTLGLAKTKADISIPLAQRTMKRGAKIWTDDLGLTVRIPAHLISKPATADIFIQPNAPHIPQNVKSMSRIYHLKLHRNQKTLLLGKNITLEFKTAITSNTRQIYLWHNNTQEWLALSSKIIDSRHIQTSIDFAEGLFAVFTGKQLVSRYKITTPAETKSDISPPTLNVLAENNPSEKNTDLVRGKASWFADSMTKSAKLGVATNLFPIGGELLVTNTDNDESIIVKIISTGPFVPGRLFDLTKSAFSKIADPKVGVIEVEVIKL